MVTCTGHISIHEGADVRTEIFSHRWVTSIFLAMVLRGAQLKISKANNK